MTNHGQIIELFSSVQGEGPYIGHRQVFLRFAGCNLNCSYCDTTHDIPTEWKWEKIPGRNIFELMTNPIKAEELACLIKNYGRMYHHSLSLTGGEPLLQLSFLKELLGYLGEYLPVYLETNGTLYEQLNEIIRAVTYISMDLKMPSSTGIDLFREHKKFLVTAYLKKVFVKIVITNSINVEEFEEALNLIHNVNKCIPLILQPASNHNVPNEKLFYWQDYAYNKLNNVRIIPQAHRMLNML